MNSRFKRGGALILAILITISIPIVAFATSDSEVMPEDFSIPSDVVFSGAQVPITAEPIAASIAAPIFNMPAAPTAPTVNEAGRATESVGTLAALRPLLDNPTGTPLTITLTANIAVTGGTLVVTHPDVIIQPAAAQAITRGSGGAGSNFPAITVDGGTLVLNARLNRSGAAGTGARSGGIHVINGGTLIMDSPVSRVDGFISNTTNNAGGVTVVGTGSTFHMLRGQIDNNEGTGGGVLVRDGGTFNMFGGRIYRNEENVGRDYYTGGGGVRIMSGGIFNLVGGTPTIEVGGRGTQGTSSGTGAAVVASVVAEFAPSSTAAVQGTYAVIERNAISGGGLGSAAFLASNRHWYRARRGGAGVFIRGEASQFNMYGGTIRNNWLGSYSNEQFYGDRVVGEVGNPMGAGAGVHVTDGATFNMSYGRINNNHITAGGNTSWGAGGGGVAVRGVGTTFNMDGGIIRANSRPGWLPNYGCVGRYSESGTINTGAGLGHGSGTGGGGIYLTEGAVVTLSGNAEVHYNTARRGGGISMEGRSIGAFPTSLDVATRTNYNPSGASGNGPINGFTTWDENVTTILNITGNARIHGNLTLEGWANASGGGLFVGPHSEVRMFSGAIENNVQTNGVEAWTVNGGGARVTSRGHFIMMGGYIRNNIALHATINEPQGGLGGAIRPDRVPRRAIGGGLAARSDRNSPAGGPLRADGSRLNDARITIFGGTISGNEAGRGGGIGMNANSTVIIHGGSIIYNYAVGWPATGTGTGANAYRTAGTAGGGIGTFEATLDGINASLERLFIRPAAEIRDNRAVGLANMTTRGTGLLAGPAHWTNIHGERSTFSVLEMGTTGVGRNISLPAGFPHPTLEQIRATGHHLIINDNFYRDHGDYHHLPMNPPASGRNPWRIQPGTITEGHLHPFNNFDIGTARMAVLYPALGVQPYFEGMRQDPITLDEDFFVAHWGVAQVSVPETAANTARHGHQPRYDATLQYWRSSNFTNPPLNVMVGRPMMNIQARQFANSTAIVPYQYSDANPIMLNIREEQPRYLEVHWLDTVRNPATMTVVPAEEYVQQGRSVDLTARIQSQFYATEDYVYERYYFPLRFWDVTSNNYIYIRDNAGNQMYDFRIQRVQEDGEDVRVRVKDRVETLPIIATVTSDEAEPVSVFHYVRGADQADDCELNLLFHNHAAPISATDTLGQGGGDERTRTREVPVIFPPQSISWTVTRVDGTPEPGATVTVDRDGNITLNVTRDVDEGEIIVRGTVDGSDVTGEMRIEVRELGSRITFHAYSVGNFGTDADNNAITYVEVLVDFDEDVDLSIIESYLTSEETAFAFWGWFTHEGLATGIPRADLDAYGRRNGFRRPAVGTFGFEGGFGPTVTDAGFTRVLSFSEDEWDSISDDDSNLELFAIWSPWGDVDDNDAVNVYDLEALAGFLRFAYPRPVINMAPADVHRDGVVNVYDLEALAGFLRFAYPRPVLGARPTN